MGSPVWSAIGTKIRDTINACFDTGGVVYPMRVWYSLFLTPMPKPKFHIRSDMEGVTGVVSMAQVTPGAPEYAAAREWLMAEVGALVEGLLEGGAAEVSIYDEHWFGRNVDVGRLPKGVRVFSGKPPYRADWAGGLDRTHAGLILQGLHSREGSGRILAHTYEPDFLAISLNGVAVGEIGLESAIAGDCGVPLVLVIADDAGLEEARELVPAVAGVATKISRDSVGAECLSLSDTVAAIRQAAARIAADPPAPEPFRIEGPVEMLCSFKPGRYLEALRRREKARFVLEDTLRFTGPTVTSVWSDYWRKKLETQAGLAP